MNLRTLMAVSLLSLMTSSVFASPEALRYARVPTGAIPVTGGLALTCAMIQDYLGNDQLWFENVKSLFDQEDDGVVPRTPVKNLVDAHLGPGEPIQVRGVFRRWAGANAFILGVGYQEVLVVGRKNMLSSRNLNPNDLWVAGSFFNGLNELCQTGQGSARFIRADRVFSN